MKDYINYNQSDYPEYNSYVYWIMDKKNFKHYIGSRKSSCSDLEYDLQKYKTSSKIVKYIFNNRSEDLEEYKRLRKEKIIVYAYSVKLNKRIFVFKDKIDNINFFNIDCESREIKDYINPAYNKVYVVNILTNENETVDKETYRNNKEKYILRNKRRKK